MAFKRRKMNLALLRLVFFPFEELNGFRYHDNWFRILKIASSLNGRRPRIQS